MSLNPGHFMLGVLNARSIRNKGPFLVNIVTSHDLDFLCLTETHVHLSDTGSFLMSITPYFIFLQRPSPSGIGGGVGFFIRSSKISHKIVYPFYRLFEKMVESTGLHGQLLLLACVIYHIPGSWTCNLSFRKSFF